MEVTLFRALISVTVILGACKMNESDSRAFFHVYVGLGACELKLTLIKS